MNHHCTVHEEATLISGRSVLSTFRIVCKKCGLVDKTRTSKEAHDRAKQHEAMPHKR